MSKAKKIDPKQMLAAGMRGIAKGVKVAKGSAKVLGDLGTGFVGAMTGASERKMINSWKGKKTSKKYEGSKADNKGDVKHAKKKKNRN